MLKKQHGKWWTDLRQDPFLLSLIQLEHSQWRGLLLKKKNELGKIKKKELAIIEKHARNLIKKRETMMG